MSIIRGAVRGILLINISAHAIRTPWDALLLPALHVRVRLVNMRHHDLPPIRDGWIPNAGEVPWNVVAGNTRTTIAIVKETAKIGRTVATGNGRLM